jgi:hypothetical protein
MESKKLECSIQLILLYIAVAMAGSNSNYNYVPPGDGSKEEDNSEYEMIEAVAQAGAFQEGAHNHGEVAPLLLLPELLQLQLATAIPPIAIQPDVQPAVAAVGN